MIAPTISNTCATVAAILPVAQPVGSLDNEFRRLVSAFNRLRREEKIFDDYTLAPVQAVEARLCSAFIPVTAEFRSVDGRTVTLSTADGATKVQAMAITQGMKSATWDRDSDLNCAMRRIRAGDLLQRRHRQAIRRDLGIDALEDRSEQMGNASSDACWAAIECQVDNAQDLLIKIGLIQSEERWDFEQVHEIIARDVAVLAERAP